MGQVGKYPVNYQINQDKQQVHICESKLPLFLIGLIESMTLM